MLFINYTDDNQSTPIKKSAKMSRDNQLIEKLYKAIEANDSKAVDEIFSENSAGLAVELVKAPTKSQPAFITQAVEKLLTIEIDQQKDHPAFAICKRIFIETIKALRLSDTKSTILVKPSHDRLLPSYHYILLDYLIRAHRDSDRETATNLLEEIVDFQKKKTHLIHGAKTITEEILFLTRENGPGNGSKDTPINVPTVYFSLLDIALQISHMSLIENLIKNVTASSENNYFFYPLFFRYMNFIKNNGLEEKNYPVLKMILDAAFQEVINKKIDIERIKKQFDSFATSILSTPNMEHFFEDFLDHITSIKTTSTKIYNFLRDYLLNNEVFKKISDAKKLHFEKKLNQSYINGVTENKENYRNSNLFGMNTDYFLELVASISRGNPLSKDQKKILYNYKLRLLREKRSEVAGPETKEFFQLFFIALMHANFDAITTLIYGCIVGQPFYYTGNDKFKSFLDQIPNFIELIDQSNKEKYRAVKNYLTIFQSNPENLDHYIKIEDYILFLESEMGPLDRDSNTYQLKESKKHFFEKILSIYNLLVKFDTPTEKLNLADIVYTVFQKLKENKSQTEIAFKISGEMVTFKSSIYATLIGGYSSHRALDLINEITQKSPKFVLERCENELYRILSKEPPKRIDEENGNSIFHFVETPVAIPGKSASAQTTGMQTILESYRKNQGPLMIKTILPSVEKAHATLPKNIQDTGQYSAFTNLFKPGPDPTEVMLSKFLHHNK